MFNYVVSQRSCSLLMDLVKTIRLQLRKGKRAVHSRDHIKELGKQQSCFFPRFSKFTSSVTSDVLAVFLTNSAGAF